MFWAILEVFGWILLVVSVLIAFITAVFLCDSLIASQVTEKQSSVEFWRILRKRPGVVEYVDGDVDYKARSKAFLVAPGILAYRNQVEPLLPAIDEYDVYAFKYAGLRYDRQLFVEESVKTIRWMLKKYRVVVLDGISHGGQGFVHVLAALEPKERARIDVILHEPPGGAETLKQVPGYARNLFLFTAGPCANFVFGFVPKLFATLGGPKRETVKTPCVENVFQLTGTAMTPNEYFDKVTADAKKNLRGHNFSMWYSEIGDMVRSSKQGLPMRVLNDAKSVTYIAYATDNKNEVVDQPAAVNTFKVWADRMRVLCVDGTHAGFLDYLDENIAVLKEALPK